MRKHGIWARVGTKYLWISNASNLSKRQKEQWKGLKESTLKTARAWARKERNRNLWNYTIRTWAFKGWKRWLDRSPLAPMKKVSKTMKAHLWGIINAMVLGVSNGPAERINRQIKAIKVRARGFRNLQRFANAIYFYLGGLDLYPVGDQKKMVNPSEKW